MHLHLEDDRREPDVRYEHVFRKGIFDTAANVLVAGFTRHSTHAHIDDELGEVVAQHLNEQLHPHLSAREGRYFVETWDGVDHADPKRPEIEYVAVSDRRYANPMLGIMFVTTLRPDGAKRAAVVETAEAIARILNHIDYDWSVRDEDSWLLRSGQDEVDHQGPAA